MFLLILWPYPGRGRVGGWVDDLIGFVVHADLATTLLEPEPAFSDVLAC